MKKLFIVIIVAVLACFALCACNKVDLEAVLLNNVSFAETTLYEGATANFEVGLSIGKKEDSFAPDGAVGKVCDYAVLTLVPQHMDLFNKNYTYAVKGASGEIKGQMVKDVFGVSYTAKLVEIDEIGTVWQAEVVADTLTEVVELKNLTANAITLTEILKTTAKEFRHEITTLVKKNSFTREIYIKFITDKSNVKNPSYWYVAIIGDADDFWSILIEPNIGSVICKAP